MTTTMTSKHIDPQQDNLLFPKYPHWQACFAQFLSELYGRSGSISTYVNYRSIMFQMYSRDPERDPASITLHDVRLFINRVSTSARNRGRALSPSTKNTNISCLASFYKMASTWESSPGVFLFRGALPTQGLRPYKRGTESRYIPPDDLAKLFATCDRSTLVGKRDYALLVFFLVLCRRKREVQSLTWGDLEQTTICEKSGERRPGWVYHWRAKGNQRQELVNELPEICYQVWLDYAQASGRFETIRPEDPLFATKYYGKMCPMSMSAITAIFKARCAACGISERYSIHWLRHSGAKVRWESGAGDLFEISRLLGHANPATSWRYLNGLTGLSDKASEKVVERLPFLASAQKQKE